MRSNIWNGTISFGLLNIPVSLQSAQEDKSLSFSLLDKKNLAPIRYKKINSKTGKEVSAAQIIKGYKSENGEYVLMTPEDFQAANPKATQTIDIEDFVLLDEIDLLFFEKPYYLVPKKGAEKSYTLLKQALGKTKKVAIAKIVMHTKQRLCCIMVRDQFLILEILRYAHEVKETHEAEFFKPLNAKSAFKPQELKMAEQLIEGMSRKWEPDQYEDTYYRDVMTHIRKKIKQGKSHSIEKPETTKSTETPKATKGEDMMSLLKKSLALKGKPSRSSRTHVH